MKIETENDVVAAIKAAKGPLRIRGGGTRPIGRVTGEVLSVAGLSGITLYEPGALTLVAQAGTPVAEIKKALAAENQRLAFEPMDHRALLGTKGKPTIGGVVAANVSGPRRIAVGAARDFLLGVRFVDGAGQVVKNGGRVMKNVTGYDLVKLMAGSYGTLGVLTEVSLKVLPDVEAMASLSVAGLSDEAAVKAMAATLGSPFEVTGAAHGDGVTHIRIEGFTNSVAYRAEKLAAVLAPFGVAEIETKKAAVAKRWAAIRDVDAFAKAEGDVWRVSVKPSDAPDMVARLGARAVQYDWAGGLIWVLVDAGTDLRARMGAFTGHATLIRGTADAPVFQPEPAPLAAISAGIRAKFDPRNILNTGVMG